MYAQDQNLFFQHYAEAHVKMSEWGQEQNLLSEFDTKVDEQNRELGFFGPRTQ